MSKRHWVTLPHERIEVTVAATGNASLPPVTIIEAFDKTVQKLPDKGALFFKTKPGQSGFDSFTFTQFREQVYKVAKSIIKLGVQKWERVGILGFNSPEWFIADVASVYAGCIPFGIYTTNGPEACQFVLEFTKCPLLVLENAVQLRKIREVASQLPLLKTVVVWSGTPVKEASDPWQVLSWQEFRDLGSDLPDQAVSERTLDIAPGNCACLIFTSGTTGPPKAVMVSHDNLTWVTSVVRAALAADHNDSWVSYLPLSHIAAKMVDLMACVVEGTSVYFAQPDALKGTLVDTLREVRPTLFLGVPRVWEKMMEKLQAIGAANSGIKKKIGTWAKKKGAAGSLAKLEGKSKPSGWSLANSLVFKKVKAGLGLDRMRVALVGAAPMSRDCTLYFMSLDISVFEVFGMSESTGCVTFSINHQFKIGACGSPIEGVDLKINRPDSDGNGEITFKGRNLMMGYLFDEPSTVKDIDADGFFHTGDIGKLFDGTHLGITGRIKELIITAGGENIPPLPIEESIKRELAIVSNCMVIGDKRKFLSCLLTLRCLVVDDEPTQDLTREAVALCKAIGSDATTLPQAIRDPKVIAAIDEAFVRVNKKAISHAHTIQKWVILPNELSISGNELGPTLKMKRRTIATKYDSLIETLYVE
ncbi:long-chain-fatty-acid-CoA ligase ACSBG2 [Capsaspora owczarzaki ATCC 30864]|uniref:Long-chain-fatty-acid-CoA ligase ACSBG2 n=1 Tax=Capsaspora owczarzaki (strain ATCC 30864) TaxID=595528 RepID=A0A0D2VJQ6_CAPO3|nr:long-chain-fatty-acid-CoA ligase ACSBG2 [Capsaspora owczarzaki ATCC 30864]KJE90232.1 long-chain-fatty-acid-CoA ligase ACSBG2 [Capsaspora owczarzaki ATCC 30864]|eukprot:XP_004364441.2 long-chain-fatty-acid-CoA ligase ACSBG2 [Capsaspora owczarzaki ATCC 30864]